VVLALTAITVGITTGVMFCFQLAIMPGLGRLPDKEFIAAFQQFDKKIVHPVFILGTFLGGGALLIVATFLYRHESESATFRLLAGASALYLLGVVVLTLAFHVPRNNTLADFSVASATVEQAAAARQDFEGPWIRAHVVRTLASVASLALVAFALALDKA
jgi:uncharacterized membrane protein